MVKGAVNFVKKHWKTLVIVGLTVFSMGVASSGWGAFTQAIGEFGGGFGGFMQVVGSTMYSGLTALGGTLSIGQGAAGTVAKLGGVQGTGLFGGHLAAALGSNVAKAGIASQLGGAAGPGVTLTGIGAAPTATTVGEGVGAKAGTGLFGSDMAKAALITTGGNMLSGYAAGKASEPPKQRGFWGVDVQNRNDRSGDVVFDPGAVPLSSFTPPTPAASAQPAAPVVPAVGQPAAGAPMTPQQLYQLQLLVAQQGGLMNQPWAVPQGA